MFKRSDIWVSIVAVLITAIVIGKNFPFSKLSGQNTWLVFLACGWGVVPPAWFLLEWHWKHSTTKDEAGLKYAQELARNLWLGVAAVIALLFKVMPGPPPI
jgi:hypothetical protein